MDDSYEIYPNKELENFLTSFKPIIKKEKINGIEYNTLTLDSYTHALAVVLAHEELEARKALKISF